MRPRSVTGPLILILIGALFLWYNLRPDVPVWQVISVYWPFFLIAWGALRLLEVLFNAIAGRPLPRGLSGGEIVLIVLLCVFGSVSFSAYHHGWNIGPGRLEMFGEQYDYPVSAQAALGNAKRIVFQNIRGNLRISGADTQEVRITGRKNVRAFRKSDADQADRVTGLEIYPEGDHILVRGNADRVSGDRRVSSDLEVTVPRSVSVEAHSRSGDIDVSDVAGDVDVSSDRSDVRLSKIGGNGRVELHRSDLIRAADVKGNLDLQGRGSDVQLENVDGQVTVNGSYSGTLSFKNLAKPLHFESPNTDLQVERLPGQINMDLGDLSAKNLVGPIRLKTKSKDVRIEDFTDSLDLETERGDIEIQPGRVPLGKIDARSSSGKIELALPEKAAFDLVATANHGEAVNDFGPQIQTQTDGQASSLKGAVGKGPTISITTQHGSVLVRKAVPETGQAASSAPAAEKF
jgi:DUF4097 and DUF4098 domain-containing protein YvlB